MKILLMVFGLYFGIISPLTSYAFTYPVLREDAPFSGSSVFVPNNSMKQSSVVLLHGSEGGSEYFLDLEANILAMQGYAVLVLCYFDCNRGMTGPRKTLKNVEATVVLDAVAWLRSRGKK